MLTTIAAGAAIDATHSCDCCRLLKDRLHACKGKIWFFVQELSPLPVSDGFSSPKEVALMRSVLRPVFFR